MTEQELLWDCRSWAPQHSSCWDMDPTALWHSTCLGPGLSSPWSFPALGHRHTPPKGSALHTVTLLGQHSPGTPPHLTLGPRGLDWDRLGRSIPRGKDREIQGAQTQAKG